ncbi:MAG TPA: TetR/AcrR family transcriptional regulator [Gordonia sp. (in: high G+C Gram-positive bacteria)]|uniref:TetR/AcrR family transcriptional regulator n=1 Tax=unclassified Gordonia (in: high G+C Gram-positive bacteria) TaxID=2657482 RepID=UPI000FB880E4|nr:MULTISPECIES: TetR/AcrR family transcriptional regulator [unclassified Gordonia (in: high G+C Gram-positive bacteria)]RUP37092.1 MAG: TetR/AcrR family transcriptional regulator [Gordonia sp. (in: high G+C Gram-positive bacteria)]HNP55456.1 TetR/AcrR family transcriptional regulator [Gordonia sp. (in: high G+C Gram-positive bacteria)]HRC50127.1 TetR/AcrR family transcriptional regulator [Gordonia sp. (in: high G+C Gram-positive bacteria)]
MTERLDNVAVAGRPRDPGLDRAILSATLELLAEVGYAKTTISAIARRSGVATPAIYRRWSSKEAIVEEAVFGSDDAVPPPASGDLRTDLTAWARWFLAQIAEPSVRTAIPGLIASYQHSEGAHDKLLARWDHPIRHALIELIVDDYPDHAAQAPTVGDEVFDLLVASTTIRGLTRGNEDAHAFCTRTADTLALIVAARFAADA